MTWRLEETSDLDAVLALYEAVFGEQLARAEIEERGRGRRLHAFTVGQNGEPPAGFAMFLGKGNDVELWQSGVLPGRRHQGAGACLLERGEHAMAELGYSRLTVRTFNHWNVMLSMLTRRGWRIVGTGRSERHRDLYIDLHKALRTRRELRYAVTHRCNFDCLFCHNEGLGQRDQREPAPLKQVLAILHRAVERGYTDITFTGGEPLLEKERLLALVAGLAAFPEPPALTLVSNSALLDEAAVAAFAAYPGECKLHVSLHAADAEAFSRVTRRGTPQLFDRIQHNVRLATGAGLRVKVNCVLLRDVNHDHIARMVEMSRSLGASALKLLELLVLPGTPGDYGLFYRASAIERQLAEVALGPQREGLRRQVWRHREDAGFVIEVQQLTCALGCAHCREVRDRTLSSNLCYHPCFVRDSDNYPLEHPDDLEEVFARGDRIIDGLAAEFGDRSPTLAYAERMAPSRSGMFFAVRDADALRACFARLGAPPPKLWSVEEEFFRPRHRGPEWDRWERVLRLGWTRDDRSKGEVVFTDNRYEPAEGLGLLTLERFLYPEGPLDLGTPDRARHLLDRFDFEPFLTVAWELEFYDLGACTVSLGTNGGLATVRVDGDVAQARAFVALLEVDGAAPHVEPLAEPLEGWLLRERAGGSTS